VRLDPEHALVSGSLLSFQASLLHGSLRLSHVFMYAHVVLTSRAGTLVPTLDFCLLSGWLPNGSRPAPLRVSWYLPRVRLDPKRTSAFVLSPTSSKEKCA